MSDFRHLTPKDEYTAEGPDPSILDTFEAPQNVGETTYTSDEVTALCPITGQPDFYVVEIMLYDNSKCLESKALKLYLGSFRNHGEFCEAMATRIAEDVASVICPGGVRVVVNQKPRGGISISSTASRFMPSDD